MAKVIICDICNSKKKLVLATRNFRIKKMPNSRMDVCEKCYTSNAPKNIGEYKDLFKKIFGRELK